MKKLSLSILLALLGILSIFAFSACDENHTCEFTYRIPSKTFQVRAPSCTTMGTYYKVCKCGKHGSETFTHEEKLPHNFVNEIKGYNTQKEQATCTHPAIYYKSCDCGEISTSDTFTVGVALPHNFNDCIEDDTYLKSAPTYVSKGEYYYACTGCGAKADTYYETDYLEAEGSGGIEFALSPDGTYYTVTSVADVTDSHLVIPVAYDGKYVTEINIPSSDYENRLIYSVTIPETITAVSQLSFMRCPKIVEVINHSDLVFSVEDGRAITELAKLIHTGDESLVKRTSGYSYIVDEDGVTSLINLDSDEYTYGGVLTLPQSINGSSYTLTPYAVECTGVTQLVIPDGAVNHISTSALYNAGGLMILELPSGIDTINGRFMDKDGYTTPTHILCRDDAAGDDWATDWNYYSDTVIYGFTGREVTYYFWSDDSSLIESITSNYPIALPTPEATAYRTFEGWYLDQECTASPLLEEIYYCNDYEVHIYAKWGEIARDGVSMSTAFILSLGTQEYVTTRAGQYVYYEFTATSSKTYYFQSSKTGGDPKAWFYDEYGYSIGSDDDSGGSRNFYWSRYMTAGEKIYIKVGHYSSSSASSFYFYVS